MKKLSALILAGALLVTSGALVTTASAQDLPEIKARIAQRLPTLDEMKGQGFIGEDNRGMVELRGGGTAAGDVVAAENRDRGIVYAAIAKQTGVTAEEVGRARARQIAGASAKGVWVQRADNTWARK